MNKMIAGWVIFLSLFILTGIYLGKFVEATTDKVSSIPSHYFLWGLGILAGGVILWLIAKNDKAIKGAVTVSKSRWFWVPVALALVVVAYHKIPDYFPNGFGKSTESTVSVPRPAQRNLPADLVLSIIADCESGDCSPGSARQFEDDGVTPYRNREGSSAIGKWQIIRSTHRELCPDFDIKTEAGNEACATRLYEESGTKHWEADPRSKARWLPILIELAGGQLPEEDIHVASREFVVVVGPEWSQVYRFPQGMTVSGRGVGPEKRFVMQTASGTYHFSPEHSDHVPGNVPWARFRSATDSLEEIRVRLY